MTRPALLMHCQHSVGLGHLVRTLALADALSRRFRVTLLCGGEIPEALPVPDEVELVPMSPLTLGEEASLVSATAGLSPLACSFPRISGGTFAGSSRPHCDEKS